MPEMPTPEYLVPCPGCGFTSGGITVGCAECARRHPERYAAWAEEMARELAELRAEMMRHRKMLEDREPDLWQYATPDPAGLDGPIVFEGTPSYISPRYVRRPLRAVGDWQPVPKDGL